MCVGIYTAKAAITWVRKLTDSHPKGVRQNGWYLLHVITNAYM